MATPAQYVPDPSQRAWAPATWLAEPTLKTSSSLGVRTAGVLYHKETLNRLVAAHGPLVMVDLRVEMEGDYAGAVRVHVAGEQVGSVPHDEAEQFRDVVHQLDASGKIATARASIEAGEWFDVWVHAVAEPRPEDEYFLPSLAGVRVELFEGAGELLDASLHSKAKRKSVARRATLDYDNGEWWVLYEAGARIGRLERPFESVGYSHLVEAATGGWPLTCQIRLVREQGKPFRVVADLPA